MNKTKKITINLLSILFVVAFFLAIKAGAASQKAASRLSKGLAEMKLMDTKEKNDTIRVESPVYVSSALANMVAKEEGQGIAVIQGLTAFSGDELIKQRIEWEIRLWELEAERNARMGSFFDLTIETMKELPSDFQGIFELQKAMSRIFQIDPYMENAKFTPSQTFPFIGGRWEATGNYPPILDRYGHKVIDGEFHRILDTSGQNITRIHNDLFRFDIHEAMTRQSGLYQRQITTEAQASLLDKMVFDFPAKYPFDYSQPWSERREETFQYIEQSGTGLETKILQKQFEQPWQQPQWQFQQPQWQFRQPQWQFRQPQRQIQQPQW